MFSFLASTLITFSSLATATNPRGMQEGNDSLVLSKALAAFSNKLDALATKRRINTFFDNDYFNNLINILKKEARNQPEKFAVFLSDIEKQISENPIFVSKSVESDKADMVKSIITSFLLKIIDTKWGRELFDKVMYRMSNATSTRDTPFLMCDFIYYAYAKFLAEARRLHRDDNMIHKQLQKLAELVSGMSLDLRNYSNIRKELENVYKRTWSLIHSDVVAILDDLQTGYPFILTL